MQLQTLFISRNTFPLVVKTIQESEIYNLKYLISFDDDLDKSILVQLNTKNKAEIKVLYFTDIIKLGDTVLSKFVPLNRLDLIDTHSPNRKNMDISKFLQRKLPTSKTIYQISFSSGTTGKVKGSKISHQNIISGISGGPKQGYLFSEEDVYLSYVPLSHI